MGEDPTGIVNDLPYAHIFWFEASPNNLEGKQNFLEEGKAPEDLPTNKNKVLDLKFAPFKSLTSICIKWEPMTA
jgi:hypothetical protein